MSVGITGGTLGIGPEVGFRSNGFGARGSVTFLGISREIDSDGVNYDGSLRLRSFGGSADLYPFGGGFRLSAGARISGNRIALRARPTEDVEIGDNVYTPEEIGEITGRVRANRFAPTLTAGWGGGLTKGVKFGADAGIMFQGRPRVSSLRTTGMLNSPEFQADIERERREVEDDIDNFKVYPILQFSLGYRF